MHLDVAPVTSGLAVGSLMAGIGSVLVSLLVLCFGVAGCADGWGGWVAGAFALLGVLVGGGGDRRSGWSAGGRSASGPRRRVRFTGRGLAIAGISCGRRGWAIAVPGAALAVVSAGLR